MGCFRIAIGSDWSRVQGERRRAKSARAARCRLNSCLWTLRQGAIYPARGGQPTGHRRPPWAISHSIKAPKTDIGRALKGRNLISLALQCQVGIPQIPTRPEGAEPNSSWIEGRDPKGTAPSGRMGERGTAYLTKASGYSNSAPSGRGSGSLSQVSRCNKLQGTMNFADNPLIRRTLAPQPSPDPHAELGIWASTSHCKGY